MKQEKHSSFFDIIDRQNTLTNIWENFKHTEFQSDIIECQFECQRVSRKKRIFKPILISIGIETLYCSKNNEFKRILPLTFTTIRNQLYCNRFVIQLTRNSFTLELLIPNHNQIWQVLAMKCVQTTFHDEFYVESKLGKGNFAFVFLAIKKCTGTHYAVKAFSKEHVLSQNKGKESLLNEINVMRKLKSENILRLQEVHETINSIYLVVDYCSGGSLQSKLHQKLDIQQFMHKLLKGIHYMHQKKCMHRDLKPSNILLKTKQSDSDFVIGDFGLAQFIETKPIYQKCGTPGFVAPEVLNYSSGDQFYNEKCDIFSAGVIFYLLLTGKSIFGKDDLQNVILKNKNCSINYDVKEIKEASSELRDILRKMLDDKPHTRLSAEDCLKHSFFQDLPENQKINGEDQQLLNSSTETLSSELPEITSIISQREGYLLQDKLFNGTIKTIGSMTMHSPQSSPKVKQTEKLSKFSQFCQVMETLKNESQKQKKQNQDSLHKVVIKKAFLQKMNSLDTDFVLEDIVEPNEPKPNNVKPNEIKKQRPKKSNSMDI